MSKFLCLLILSIILVGAWSAPKRPSIAKNTKPKDDRWWTNSKATLLSSKSFESAVGKDKFALVQFCALFSKECQDSTPVYDKLAEMYTGANAKRTDLTIARIDGWTFNSLSQTFGVKKFPHYRFFQKNDNQKNQEYTGELNADKISEWLEATIKAIPAEDQKAPEAAKPADEKKPEDAAAAPAAGEPAKDAAAAAAPAEPAKEAVKEAPKEPAAEPAKEVPKEAPKEAAKEAPKKEEEKPKAPEAPREVQVVLNTTLLQAQFDEVQNQMNKLREALEKNIADHFGKVEALNKAFETHTQTINTLSETVKSHGDVLNGLEGRLSSTSHDIKNAVTSHAEQQFNGLKETVSNIKDKVHEKIVEGPKEVSGPGFMHNILWLVIGSAVGGVAVFFLASGGGKKRRSMLD